ncbi:MAG: TIGR00730 family Rossman fold protein [Magnetococcales bacterium]|nr:TIGR00730 family Rossman fold protein [Magnetococcales bacterium]
MDDFKTTEAWRVFRIQAELIDGIETLRGMGPAVTIFGSARTPDDDASYLAAKETAELFSKHGVGVITGGGPGIMEAANKGAFSEGAVSVGLNIALPFEQQANHFQDVSISFRYFFVRKLMFAKYADAFIIFPGGFGTLDELFEALTLVQTGKMRHLPIILYGSDYWQGLLQWLRSKVLSEGCISKKDLNIFHVVDNPRQALSIVSAALKSNLKKQKKLKKLKKRKKREELEKREGLEKQGSTKKTEKNNSKTGKQIKLK